jgi:ribosome-associated protein
MRLVFLLLGIVFVNAFVPLAVPPRAVLLLARTALYGTSSRDRMIARALEKIEHKRELVDQIALSEEPLLPMLTGAIRAADSRKAGGIVALRVSHLSEIATFMLIVEGNSRPQIQAIANTIEDDLLLHFTEQPSKEGTATSGWIVLDYGSIIVHIMTPPMRNFYKIERRWRDAEVVDHSSMLLGPQASASAMDEGSFSDDPVGSGEDPFWS